MHDGILIGVGTALNDNPQLNGRSSDHHAAFTTLFENHCYLVRHLPFPSQESHFRYYHHPRPLILDSSLRVPPKCKLIANAALGAGITPWVISSRQQKVDGFWANEDEEAKAKAWEERKAVLERAGVKVILIERQPLRMSTALSCCP